jgi:signal transduction histidine kinase
MKNIFLSVVSHELQTPITICRGHLEVLGQDADPEETAHAIGIVVDELDRMGRMVKDITTLARMENNEFLAVVPVPLEPLVDTIATKAEPLLGPRLRVQYIADGATIRADPQRMTQALLNLLQNAAVHTRGEGPICFRVAKESAHWRFEVIDEGGGIPPGEERLIFEPFRMGSSRTGRTGLGLAIARGIAVAHGGMAGVVNRPGRGATFWIRIPR